MPSNEAMTDVNALLDGATPEQCRNALCRAVIWIHQDCSTDGYTMKHSEFRGQDPHVILDMLLRPKISAEYVPPPWRRERDKELAERKLTLGG